jgi:hypothetical protein
MSKEKETKKKSAAGKGDSPRYDFKKYQSNYDNIFKKKINS